MDAYEIIDYVKINKKIPQCEDTDLYAALIIAVENGDLEAVKLFLKNKIVLAYDDWSPLNAAIERNKTEIAIYLIENGVSTKRPKHNPPYFQCINEGNAQILECILKNDVNLNIDTHNLIQKIIQHKKLNCLDVLLSNGVSIGREDVACMLSSNWVECLNLLHQHGIVFDN